MTTSERLRDWGRRKPVAWGMAALSGLLLVAFVVISPQLNGPFQANLLIGLALVVAVAAGVGLRFVPDRNVREWTALFLTIAVVYGILASFSIRNATPLAAPYLVDVGFTVAFFAIFALGLSIQMGYAGLLNFGHVGFMLLGAYVVTLWTTEWGIGLAPAFEGAGPGAILMTGIAGGLLAVLVYGPLSILMQRLPASPRVRILAAAVPAAVLALWFAWSAFPLDTRAAMGMMVLLGVLLAIAIAALAALFLGVASLRLREDYLAIVTLGTAEILRIYATNLRDLTNGSLGVQFSTGAHHLPIASWSRVNDWFREWARDSVNVNHTLLANAIVALIVLAFAFLLLEVLARSPWGRVLTSIREDEEVAAALGKNVLLSKLQALMIGAALAAVAGILFVWKKTNTYPTDFLPIFTFYAVAILVLGGIGNHKGAVIGAAVLWGIREFAANMNTLFRSECAAGDANIFVSIFCDFAGAKEQMLIGLVMVVVILFRPQGVVGNKEELAHAK